MSDECRGDLLTIDVLSCGRILKVTGLPAPHTIVTCMFSVNNRAIVFSRNLCSRSRDDSKWPAKPPETVK